MLREPVDLEVGVERAQLLGDRDVALRMAEADRRRDVQRSLAPRLPPDPARRRRRRREEVAQQQVHGDGIARMGRVARPLERDERSAGRLGQRRSRRVRANRVLIAVQHEHGAVDFPRELPDLRPRRGSRRPPCPPSVSGVVSSPQPTESSICFVEWGSMNTWEKKNWRKSA
jgi:hypothetical protein